MTPEESLQSIGLNEKEASMYMACLELGQETISTIARKARVKRPTAYLLLDSLQHKGLINSSTRGKRTLYGVEDPQKLVSLLAEKQRMLKTMLPYLEALNNKNAGKPRVRFYEGYEGLHRIYEEVYASSEIRFWGSIQEVSKDLDDVLAGFVQQIKKKNINVFDLLTDTEKDRAYARTVSRPGYEVRFFPKELAVKNDAMIFENKVAMVAFAPAPHGLIIESADIHESMKSLWELAWRGAEAYKR